jgi:hypothetical protein
MQIIRTTTRKARKQHECNACLFLFEDEKHYRNLGATISEYRKIAAALAVNGKILPGETYTEVFYVHDGSADMYRHKPDINDICEKYHLYPE